MYAANLGSLLVGPSHPVRIMGVLNLSPESFYSQSIVKNLDEAVDKAIKMVDGGADIIDVGGMSTAPYKETFISEEKEIERVKPVVKELSKNIDVPISIDTRRSRVAETALKAGAVIVNDTSGFKHDLRILDVIRNHDVSAVAMAYGKTDRNYDPIMNVRRLLMESLKLCSEKDVNINKVVVDPGIGFFRNTGVPWYEWDTYVISNLYRLTVLKRPILVGVSRKSFIGKILSQENPEDRLYGSLASEVASVLNGANIIRTHNVMPTVHAVRMAERLKRGIMKVSHKDVEAIDITYLWREDDIKRFLSDLAVDPGGVNIMAGKGVYKLLYIKKIPKMLALVVKQELLAVGGDAATPKDTILGGFDTTDIIVMGNKSQLKKLINKLKSMRFVSLRKKGLIDAQELASVIQEIIDT